ncbi:MAG: 50S ribosomal protein L1 [Candidatus Hodarchaeaceae archaeon]|nr:50S ribosomal protein L1 [Candidatus Hodarchaeaceae archaeon]
MPVSREKLLDAIKRMRETSERRNFTQSVDLTLNLKDIDLKKPENRINEEALLPHGVGKPRKVAIFAEGELARKARESGADLLLAREDIDPLQKDRKRAKQIVDGYDFFLAQADLMPLIGKQLGPVLGPRGKMPKPIPPTADPKPLIERCRRMVRIRTREQPALHVPIGLESMTDEQLAENAQAVLEVIEHRLERGLNQIGSLHIKTTMGKPTKIEA